MKKNLKEGFWFGLGFMLAALVLGTILLILKIPKDKITL